MGVFTKEVAGIARFRRWLSADNHFCAKLLGASALGVLALGLLGSMLLYVALRERKFDLKRTHTLEFVRFASQIETELSDLETLNRAQTAIGNPESKGQFERRTGVLQTHLDELQQFVLGEPSLATEVVAARQNLELWLQRVAGSGEASSAPEREAVAPSDSSEGNQEKVAAAAPEASLIEDAIKVLKSVQSEALMGLSAQAEHRQSLDSSFQVLVAIPKLNALVSDMEKAEWGWLLTGNRVHYENNREAWGIFNAYFGHLSVLLSDNLDQHKRLTKIKESVDSWQREIAGAEFSTHVAAAEAPDLITKNKSRAALDGIRAAIKEMERAQSEIYDRARVRLDWDRLISGLGTGMLCMFALAVMVSSSWYSFAAFRRQLRKVQSVEDQTRSILESTLDGIIVFSEKGVIIAVNPAAEKMFGLTDRELIGRNISRLFPHQSILKELATKSETLIAAMANRQNLYAFPVEISISEMPGDRNKQYVALVRDVTERKRSEETLRQIGLSITSVTGEEFLRSLVKQLSKALQTDYAFVMEVNRGAQALTLSEKGHIRSIPRFALEDSFCNEVLKKGFMAVSAEAKTVFSQDELVGDLLIESVVATQLTDHRGKAVGVMGVLSRTSMPRNELVESTLQIFAARAAAEIERKRFAEDLAAEKERLAITLRSIGDGFIATDVDGKILLMNPVAEKLTGWAQEQAIARPLMEVFRLYNERTRSFSENAVQRIIETGSAVGLANGATIIAKDGSQRSIETTASPIRDKANRKIGIVLVFRDVTERLRLEDEHRKAEKLESLGVAAGGIAHDFNNLLTAIIGNLSLALMDMHEDHHVTERVTTAKKASLRAQDLAQQLLTFAKGGAPIKKTATIGQMLQDTVKFSLRGSNVRSEFQVSADLWPVEVDAGQISQVITNLTVNAEQAMPAGGTIHLVCENFEVQQDNHIGLRHGKYVKISVLDEGIGIPEDYLQKIFDPYFTTKPKGSGLGLATAYSIIKNHDGVIMVESTPGEGTAFHIYLPASEKSLIAALVEEGPAGAAAAKQAAQPTAGSRGRILVLDDEEVICALVTAALASAGYEVTEALDAATAIRLYDEALRQGRKFEAIITDLTIPGGMGGLEAVKILREMDPEVKAIVSSGYATDPVMSRYREYGFSGCISKPYEVAALCHVVNEVLSATKETQIYHDFVQAELA